MGAFSIFSSKRRRPKSREEKASAQYESYAKWTGYAKYLTLFLLILFIIFSFTFFNETLSMDNFRYMLKFLSVNNENTAKDGLSINFDSAGRVIAVMAGGDLTVVDTNGVQIFDISGQRFLKDTGFYSDPMCLAAGNNIVVSDRGGLVLNIYSVYAKLFTKTFSYPINDLAASENGSFAVLTAAKGYRSGIEVYDSEFRIIYYYYFADRYTSGIGLSPDGKRAAACTLTNTPDGRFLGGLYVFDVTDAGVMISFEYPDEIPWKVWFLKDGSFLFMTNKAVRIYERQGGETGKINFGDQMPKMFAFNDDYIALSLATAGLSNASTLKFYNSAGEFLGEKSYRNDVPAMDIIGDCAYIYSVGTLYTIKLPDILVVKQEDAGLTYISALYDKSGGRVVFLYSGKAVFYKNE